MSARLRGAKQRLNKERFQMVENYEMLAARVRKLITARARKNKRTARMLANARKDHSIPLLGYRLLFHFVVLQKFASIKFFLYNH